MKKLIVFDLDGTLAPASRLSLHRRRRCCMTFGHHQSGGDLWRRVAQFEKQLLSDLPKNSCLAICLCFQPVNKVFQYNGKWVELYSEDLTADQRKKIIDSLNKAVDETGYRAKKLWGEAIEDREAR